MTLGDTTIRVGRICTHEWIIPGASKAYSPRSGDPPVDPPFRTGKETVIFATRLEKRRSVRRNEARRGVKPLAMTKTAIRLRTLEEAVSLIVNLKDGTDLGV